jgi:hypothetical protein
MNSAKPKLKQKKEKQFGQNVQFYKKRQYCVQGNMLWNRQHHIGLHLAEKM